MNKKGDIVLVRFPFTDLSGIKIRPALILFYSEPDYTVAFISSRILKQKISDILLFANKKNGLKTNSYLRLTKLATLKETMVLGTIGQLKTSEKEEVNLLLKEIYQI